MARKRLGEILIQAGVLDEASLNAALAEQRRWGGQLGRILIDMHLVDEDVLVRALSHQLNFPVVNLDQRSPSADVLDLIPGDMAEKHSMVPFNMEGRFLDVAMSDPTNLGIIDELRIRTQLNVRSYLAGPKMIERALSRCYGRGVGKVGGAFTGGARPTSPAAGDPSMMYGGGMDANVIDLEPSRPVRHSSVVTPMPQPTPGSVVAPMPQPPVQAPAAAAHDPESAAFRRAQSFGWSEPAPSVTTRAAPPAPSAAEIRALHERIAKLESLVSRDEDVLRKVLGLLVEKGVATREEILERIK